jgi:pilus assembly protein CpaE
MPTSLNILVLSRSKPVLEAIGSVLRDVASYATHYQLQANGQIDPLQGRPTVPQVLILHIGPGWREQLEALSAQPADRRPALILVGGEDDPQFMRTAMQAGARDVLSTPIVAADLLTAIGRVDEELRQRIRARGTLSAFINAKGGCGATFLACNVAHMLAAEGTPTALIDLDLQFGSVPVYLDLIAKRGIHHALRNLESLDELALRGYFVKHKSGLHVLGRVEEEPLVSDEPAPTLVKHLLEIATASHDRVVVDLPRRVDAVCTAVVESADHIVVVLQQSVTTLRDAARLVRALRSDLGVAKDRIEIVINRYDRRAPIALDDIRTTLAIDELTVIPNDFATVSDCIDSGAALLDHSRAAAITRSVAALETRLGGNSPLARPGLLARTLSNFLPLRSA